MYSKNNILIFRAIFGGVILNLLLPFTYTNGNLVTKSIFSIGNYALILPYAFLMFIGFLSVTKKDVDNRNRILLDKTKDIPKRLVRSILEILFGIIFIFLLPLLGGAILFWSGMQIKLVVLMCLVYEGIHIYFCKKYYWKD